METSKARLSITDKISWGTNQALVCPRCDNPNLHHLGVRLYDRDEDAETVRVVETGKLHVTMYDAPSEGSMNPSMRRHGMHILFSCEHCDEAGPSPLLLALYQHKGVTYVEWEVVKVTDEIRDMLIKAVFTP